VRLLAAIDAMDGVLVSVDAPARQLSGVRAWRDDVSAAVQAARPFAAPRGMSIVDGHALTRRGWSWHPCIAFVHGQDTHAAWVSMCKAIVDALRYQLGHAQDLYDTYRALADKALRNRNMALNKTLWNRWERDRVNLLEWTRAALAWKHAAMAAIDTGQALIRQENKIQKPIGLAIAAAGGITQVAQTRHYHQAGES
jgi:hypothetical protein